MDLVSQAVLGGCAAQAAVGHRLPRSAWLIGCIAGLLPDADVLIRPAGDPLGGLLWHRHFTHALVVAPAIALVVAAAFAVSRGHRERFGAVFVASLLAVLTHAPLDAATSYGTHLWWPFTTARTSWDLLPILDPLVTLPAMLLLAISVWRTWRWGSVHAVGGEANVRAWFARGLAAMGVVWFVGYAGLGALQRSEAASVQTALAASRGHTMIVGRQRVMPQPLSLLLWRSVYEYQDPASGRIMIQADFIRVPHWPYSLAANETGRPQVLEGRAHDKLTRADVLARRDVDIEADPRIAETIDRFAGFADDYLALSASRPLYIGDMRYAIGAESTPLWGLIVPTIGIRGSELRLGRDIEPGRRFEDRAGELWDALLGRDPHMHQFP